MEPQTGTLRKHGVRIRLQEQPLRVLLALLDKPGEVVTREELQRQVWPGGEFGDFEHSLNIAINKIREALGDSAGTPQFVETLPRRGYRFIAPVEGPAAPPAAPQVAGEAPVKPRLPKWIPLAGILVAVVAVIGGIAWWLLPSGPQQLEIRRLTNDSSSKVGPVLFDGAKLYFGNGQMRGQAQGPFADLQVRQVPVSGGEPSSLPFVPSAGRYFMLLDITPDGRELLLLTFDGAIQPEAAPLWTMRIADESSQRVGSLLAGYARYSPDGRQIAFTSGGVSGPGLLSVASSDGSNVRRLVELKGLATVAPCWSPDGSRIAFGQFNRATRIASTWDVLANGTRLQRLFPDWRESHLPAGWTPDGRLLLISRSQVWAVEHPWLFQSRSSRRVQLTSGEPQFSDLLQFRYSRASYAVGTTPLGQLQRLDARTRNWTPHLGGISADMVEYSRDGQKVVYSTFPEGELWARHSDGSSSVRLTAAPMQAEIGRWSPDGRVIAFTGQSAPDQPRRIYLVDAAGGTMRPACPREYGQQGDFTWAPDGKKIVFDAYYAGEPHLMLLNLATGEATDFPASDGLHSPRWSPDGSTLAALVARSRQGQEVANVRQLALYSFSEGKWQDLPNIPRSAAWPSWSSNGKSIWYVNYERGTIMRYHLREQRNEEILPLKREEFTGSPGTWFNLTTNDEPMILRRRDIQQIYALELKPR